MHLAFLHDCIPCQLKSLLLLMIKDVSWFATASDWNVCSYTCVGGLIWQLLLRVYNHGQYVKELRSWNSTSQSSSTAFLYYAARTPFYLIT